MRLPQYWKNTSSVPKMFHNATTVTIIWIFIFAVLVMIVFCVLSRFIILLLIRKNAFNLRHRFSNTRFLQTEEEKAVCDALSKSLQNTFKESNIHRMVPVQPQFFASEGGNDRNATNPTIHLPLFQIAVDGKILDPKILIAKPAPSYETVVGIESAVQQSSNQPEMLTDYFRNQVQPLGVNNSMNRHEERNSFGSGASFGSFGGNEAHVPVDRPLFINTSMSASQRVDLYRRLSDPPKDNEPALAFSGFRQY